MRNVLTIARRELQAYFVSPIAYVVGAAFLIIMGLIFSLIITSPSPWGAEASLRFVFGNVFTAFILMIITPLLTMRLLAEEQRSGTLELLLTSPVRDWEVVLGKYLAALGLFVGLLVMTIPYPIILKLLDNPDPGPMFSAYLGLLLVGSSLLSLGVFTSTLTRNQIVAAVLGFGLILVLVLAEFLSGYARGPLGNFLSYLGIFNHYFDFLKGIVDTRHVIYYLSVTVAGLFLATRSLETRRWK